MPVTVQSKSTSSRKITKFNTLNRVEFVRDHGPRRICRNCETTLKRGEYFLKLDIWHGPTYTVCEKCTEDLAKFIKEANGLLGNTTPGC
jgi:hypothetical protein